MMEAVSTWSGLGNKVILFSEPWLPLTYPVNVLWWVTMVWNLSRCIDAMADHLIILPCVICFSQASPDPISLWTLLLSCADHYLQKKLSKISRCSYIDSHSPINSPQNRCDQQMIANITVLSHCTESHTNFLSSSWCIHHQYVTIP